MGVRSTYYLVNVIKKQVLEVAFGSITLSIKVSFGSTVLFLFSIPNSRHASSRKVSKKLTIYLENLYLENLCIKFYMCVSY